MSANALYRGIDQSRKFFSKNRQAFLTLGELYGHESIAEWSKQPTEPKLVNGVWTRVYRHPTSKGKSSDLCAVLWYIDTS